MKVWILPSDRRIAPFGEVAALPMLGRTLREAQVDEILGAGMTLAGGEPGDGVHIDGDVFVNAPALRAMAARRGRLRLVSPGWARLAGGPEKRDVGVSHGDGIVELDAEEKELSLARGRTEMAVAAPRLVAARIEHWSDLLWVNLLTMGSRVVSMSPVKGAGLVLHAMLRARSLNPWRIAGALVERGMSHLLASLPVSPPWLLCRGVFEGLRWIRCERSRQLSERGDSSWTSRRPTYRTGPKSSS